MNSLSYEELIQQENSDIYSLIKPFISLLPDFRPIETVERMKKVEDNGKEVIEPQDNWRLLYDEITVLTSVGREKDLELVERLITGPIDKEETIVTRNKTDFTDFFEAYRGLSWLIPYVSSCLHNVDNFYLSRGKIDLLHRFRPALRHFHMVRDEKTFDILYEEMKEEIVGSVAEMDTAAREKKSYGAYLLLNKHHNIPFTQIHGLQSLQFHPDLLDCLKDHIDWTAIKPSTFDSYTNKETLRLALGNYINKKGWALLDVLDRPIHLIKVILNSVGSIRCKAMDEVSRILWKVMGMSKTEINDILSSLLQKIMFTCEIDLYVISNSMYRPDPRYNKEDRENILCILLNSDIFINLTSSLVSCLELYLEMKFNKGIDFIVSKLKQQEDYSKIVLSHSPIIKYLMKNHEDILWKFIHQGGICQGDALLSVALHCQSCRFMDFIIQEQNQKIDNNIVVMLMTTHSLDTLSFGIDCLSSDKVYAYIATLFHSIDKKSCAMNPMLYQQKRHHLASLFYEKKGYMDLLKKLKETLDKDTFEKIVYSPIGYQGKLPLPDKLFLEACRLNIPEMIPLLNVDPSSHNAGGLFSAIEHESTKVALEILKDERVFPSALDNRCLILAIRKGNVKVVSAILKNPRLNLKGFRHHLPIDLYDSSKLSDHQKIGSILESIPEFKESKRKFLRFLY